jgi:hypothetical protein
LAGHKFGRDTSLGCASRACKRARNLAHGAWRDDPVAGDETDAAGTTRRGVLRVHLQKPARDEAQLAFTDDLHGDSEPGR